MLLFNSETWLGTPRMGRVLGRFPGPDGAATGDATPVVEARQEVGVHLVGGGDSGGGVLADG